MSTHLLVQKLMDSWSWFVLGWFPFQQFWKILNQDNDIKISVDLWKITYVHSNLFHHTGWYWYRLQLYLWRPQVTFSFALFVTLNIFIDISSFIIPKKALCNFVIGNFSSIRDHCLRVFGISNTLVHISVNFILVFFVLDNQSFLIK